MREAIDALVAGTVKTVTDAAEHAGLSREHLSRELSKPHIAEHLRQKIQRTLAVGAARAGATKLALLDSANEMVRDRASSFLLGVAGFSPDAAAAGNQRGPQQLPGLQIVIVQPPGTTVPPRIIEPEPARQIEHGNCAKIVRDALG
ncbi:hypothetical protein XI09_16855 [Bradyrhizobium sp. CCBAU 11386]|nr:hypothetical protein [Bradyrhizobium sp. CCBAU 11386]